MKDQMMDIESERFDKWLAENSPDVVPGSEEWEQAANLYYWEQEYLADQAQWDHEHGLFVASLNNVHQRYLHARQELKGGCIPCSIQSSLNWCTGCLSSMP
nr:hypothetical protein [Enterobacter sp. GER_MD16_1505_Eko_090]